MKRFLKWGFIGLLAVIVISFILLWTPDTDREAMIAKYGGEQALWTTMPSGATVHYRDQGAKDAPVIVMVHGMSSHLQTWEPLIAAMGDEFRYLSLDLPGFGLTGPNPDGVYEADVYADAAAAVMDAAGVEKAMIVGNSMGGWTAWRMGLRYPERINGLVLIDASGAPGEQTEKSNIGFKLMASPIGKLLMPRMTPRFMIKQSLLQSIEKEEIATEEMVDRYYDLIRFPGNRQASLEAMSSTRDFSPFDKIGQLQMPILILWGREDQLIDVSRAQTFMDALPQAELVIYDGVGHLPMEEIPGKVARDIKAWWRSDIAQGTSP